MDQRDDKTKGTGIGTVAGAAGGGVAGGVAAGAAVGGMTGPVGAAVGAAVGAGVGALSGRSAAGSGDSGGQQSYQTVIGAFDDTATAQRAVERLVQAGYDRDDVHLQHEQGGGSDLQAEPRTEKKKGGFFASLFGMDDADVQPMQQGDYAEHAHTYDEAVRRGSAVVVVDVQDEQQADEASRLMHELGAVDVDERSKQWRAEGWQPPQMGTQKNLAAGSDGSRTAQEGVLDVVEEQVQVGKRTLERGGVRVVQRVSSKPVREVIRLREERAVVERRPVDRAATSEDLANFQDRTLEVRETAEEAVVAKSARVVEEVRVGKEVSEREETIEETVRRKDVEVERLAGQAGRSTERERAVASDESLTGTRKGNGKDRPL